MLIGASTMYTKQHYFVDVIGGMVIAFVAYAIFLRGYPRELVVDCERLAGRRALHLVWIFGIVVAFCWVVYRERIVAL